MDYYSDKIYLLGSKNRLFVIDLNTTNIAIAHVSLSTSTSIHEVGASPHDVGASRRDVGDDVTTFAIVHPDRTPIPGSRSVRNYLFI